jgi:hypothetical protein
MGGGVSISDLRRIERAGPRAAFGFKSTVNVWASLEDSVNPYAKPISSVKYENHMTYEAMMYMALTAFASGSTYFQNCYIGLVDGSKASGGVSNFTDAASTITTGTVNYPTTNDWAEMTNYTQGVRQALVGPGIAPTTRTPSGGVLPFAAPSSPAVTMTGGTGGGSISGIFYICGQSAFGVSAVQSWWASNYTTNGPVLMSVAIGSIQSFTAAEVITVTPITFTATAG